MTSLTETSLTGSRRRDLVIFLAILAVIVLTAPRLRVYYVAEVPERPAPIVATDG